MIFLNIPRQNRATIGEISSIPSGGINFLKGVKNISLKILNDLKGSLCQFMFGTQVKRIDIVRSKNIKSNILATAADKPIFYSSSIFSTIENKSFCNLEMLF